MKKLVLLLVLLNARSILVQTAPEGIWQGYDGEWRHVSSQLIALAEATPAEKFSWRPAPGVRSTSEVYMHIVDANFYLLSVTGPKVPAGCKEGMEKTVTSKAEVIDWLKRSLDASRKRAWQKRRKISRGRCTSPIEMPRWTGFICASSFTRTSTWDSLSPTRV
jgi:hypothetical protein